MAFQPSDKQIKDFVNAMLEEVLDEIRSDRGVDISNAFYDAFGVGDIETDLDGNVSTRTKKNQQMAQKAKEADKEIEQIISAYENLLKGMMKNPNKYFNFKF